MVEEMQIRDPETPGPTPRQGTTPWRHSKFVLPFHLGEFVPFQLTFDAIENTTHFTRIAPEESPKAPDFFFDSEASVAVDRSRPVTGMLPRVSRINGTLRYVTWQYDRQLVRLDGDFSSYEDGLSGKTRSTLRRKVRKFLKESPSEEAFRVFRTPEELREFWTDARQVSKLSYQERLLGEGLPASPDYVEALTRRAEKQTVVGWIAYVAGVPVAYTVGDVLEPDVIAYGHTGYDPAYSKLSPGTVLQYLVLRFLFDETDFGVYDLCVGEAQHKRLFANDSQLCADIVYLKTNVRNRVVLLSHRTWSAINDGVLRGLELIRLKKVIKRIIRRQA